MSLGPKLKRDINSILVKLYPTPGDIRGVLIRAGIPIGGFNMAESARDSWPKIIDYSEENRRLDALVTTANREHAGNYEITRVASEMQVGDKNRLMAIAKAIKDEKCILFLGPGVLQCNQGQQLTSFNKFLARQLQIELNNGEVYYDPALQLDLRYIAQRFQTLPTYIKGDIGNLAQTHFEEIRPQITTRPFDNLALLPFSMVINTNPDNIFEQTVNSASPDKVWSSYYRFSNEVVDGQKPFDPLRNKIIEYNIFGSFKNIHSILFTEADYVAFTKNILQRTPPLPNEVIACFDETKYYMFLGFEFSLWHLKILLEALTIIRTEGRSISIYMDNPLSHHELEYFDKEFKFHFINRDVSSFTDSLVRQFNAL
ncbi:MAG TPA: SIR2 family protein [Chryseolinea sp.]|nr:SIR2 family protein [Chryseolinea sp.]